MKKISTFLTISFVVLSLGVFAQIKILSNGDVGIGLNTPTPAYKLDIVSGESRFSNLHITHWGTDPRISANSNIVFYRIDGTGYANIECQVLTEYSDSTVKENIINLNERGIETIKKLRGVSFNWKNDKDKKTQSGFLAQELEKVIPEAVFTNDDTKQKSIAYSFILPYIAEAIKEQQVQIEELKSNVLSLEADFGNLNLKSAATGTNDTTERKALLEQNIPNPFSNETKISCYIPDGVTTSAIYIYNMNETQLQQYNISGKGKQSVTINGNSFVPGMYLYALVIDGKEVDTKRMILTK